MSKNQNNNTKRRKNSKDRFFDKFTFFKDGKQKQALLEELGEELIDYCVNTEFCLSVQKFRILKKIPYASWRRYLLTFPTFKEKVEEAKMILGEKRFEMMAKREVDRVVVSHTQWHYQPLWKNSEERASKLKSEYEDSTNLKQLVEDVLRPLGKAKNEEK